MEKKEGIKINLTTLLFILTLILLIIISCFCFKFYNEKVNASNEIKTLNEQIESLQKNVNSLQETINSVSNIISNTDNDDNIPSTNNQTSKYSEITKELSDIDVLYVTDTIDNGDSYTLKGVIYSKYTISNSKLQKNLDKGTLALNNESYTIQKSNNSNEYDLFEKDQTSPSYKLKPLDNNNYYLEAQAQISDTWKLTDEYKEITVSKDLKCTMNFDYNEKYKTVDDVFKNFKTSTPVDTINPDYKNCFTFKFENNKCTEVINALTSM